MASRVLVSQRKALGHIEGLGVDESRVRPFFMLWPCILRPSPLTLLSGIQRSLSRSDYFIRLM